MVDVQRCLGVMSPILLAGILAACQGAEPQAEDTQTGDVSIRHEQVGNQELQSRDGETDVLYAKAGPDDLFFAWLYLQEAVSLATQPESVDHAMALAGVDRISDYQYDQDDSLQLSAFDFEMNLADERISLIVASVFAIGDADQDSVLRPEELTELAIDPELFAHYGDRLQFQLESAMISSIAGDDGMIDRGELANFLRVMSGAVSDYRDRLGDQAYRLQLLKSWDGVLSPFDLDHDGHLDSTEYRNFREHRSDKLEQLRML